MAVPSLGAVGNKYVINLKLLDVTKASVLERTSEIVERQDDELLAAFTRAVDRVIKKALPAPKKEPGPQPTAVGQPQTGPGVQTMAERPTPFMQVAPWVALGLTVAVGAGGGVMAGLASQSEGKASEKFEGLFFAEHLGLVHCPHSAP